MIFISLAMLAFTPEHRVEYGLLALAGMILTLSALLLDLYYSMQQHRLRVQELHAQEMATLKQIHQGISSRQSYLKSGQPQRVTPTPPGSVWVGGDSDDE